jgi:hypothetical protein
MAVNLGLSADLKGSAFPSLTWINRFSIPPKKSARDVEGARTDIKASENAIRMDLFIG